MTVKIAMVDSLDRSADVVMCRFQHFDWDHDQHMAVEIAMVTTHTRFMSA